MCELRNRATQCLVDKDLARGVGQMVIAADDVRDLHVGVVADNGEVVGGAAVGANQDHVVHDVGGEGHVAVHGVVELDGAVVFGYLQAPNMGFACVDACLSLFLGKNAAGAVVTGIAALVLLGFGALGVKRFLRAEARIYGVALFQDLKGFLISVHALHLEVGAVLAANLGALVPVKAEPFHGVDDDAHVLFGGTLGVGVLDAQDEVAALSAGESPVEDRGAGAADVEAAGRRRREADAHFLLIGHEDSLSVVLSRRLKHAAALFHRLVEA